MSQFPEGNAIIYCEGMFGTPNGKTAHGLVRFTNRYKVLSVIDSCHAGKDAGRMIDGKSQGIPIFASINEAFKAALESGKSATHLVIGLAPDGGRLNVQARADVAKAIELGLNIDCGLHDFISEDPILAPLAEAHHITIRDIRKPPPMSEQHFFSCKIDDVKSLKIVVLGTDSAVGKRTTALFLVEALRESGISAEMIGTGQTAWMQGVRFGIMLDSIINDFLTGEIEHVIWSAWDQLHPEVIVIEGQGSLLNPAYPGGYELLAAARPDTVILQHSPTRTHYDGFPNYKIHPLAHQIQAIEVVSSKPVVAITINHENIPRSQLRAVCANISESTGRPAVDVLLEGPDKLVETLTPLLKEHQAATTA
jgi:uncharacterized NAD-dependent epimerase/dehydratase family protein